MRIFLSGMASSDVPVFDEAHVNNRLIPFGLLGAMAGRKINIQKEIERCRVSKGNAEKLMFDSGVHSLNEKYFYSLKTLTKDKSKAYAFSPSAFRNAVSAYKELLVELNKANAVDYPLELDVDHFLGLEETRRIRQELHAAVPNLLPVWRMTQGKASLDELIAEYSFIAISFFGMYGPKYKDLRSRLLFGLYDKGIKTHLFAFVNEKELYQYPCYAVDSSSWAMGRRWGIVRYVSERTGKGLGGRPMLDGEQVFRDSSFLGKGASQKFDPFNDKWVTASSVRVVLAMQENMTRVWAKRGYTYDE